MQTVSLSGKDVRRSMYIEREMAGFFPSFNLFPTFCSPRYFLLTGLLSCLLVTRGKSRNSYLSYSVTVPIFFMFFNLLYLRLRSLLNPWYSMYNCKFVFCALEHRTKVPQIVLWYSFDSFTYINARCMVQRSVAQFF